MSFADRFVRTHLLVLAAVTVVTAWFSYGVFHIDEYYQVVEFARSKLAPAEVPALPWEHTERLRPWLQPFLYWCVAKLTGARDIFVLGFLFRLVTGLANVGAVTLFLRTTLPSQRTPEEARLHVRVLTLAGFLPYLAVRTSSESAAMASMVLGYALLFFPHAAYANAKTRPLMPLPPGLRGVAREMLAGLCFGLAFEFRFQTAFFVVGILAWVFFHGTRRALGPVIIGGLVAVGLGALVDRWGYGAWAFPPWNYLRSNVLEGAAGAFGKEPPFAYFWLDVTNVCGLLALALLVVLVVAWVRHPRHPLTWTTLPFFVAHGLIAHKEERFLFPMAVFALGMVTLATGDTPGRLARVGAFLHARRQNPVLLVANFVPLVLLAFYPIGWNHHVRFVRAMHERFGDSFHAAVFPEIELTPPPFHGRELVLEKLDADTLARRIAEGHAPSYLVTDRPDLDDPHLELVWSELPGRGDLHHRLAGWVDAYNASAKPPLRRLRYRTLYRVLP